MKLIQAMKQGQDLLRKADDLKQKIAKYCVDLDFETPTYAKRREGKRSCRPGAKGLGRRISKKKN